MKMQHLATCLGDTLPRINFTNTQGKLSRRVPAPMNLKRNDDDDDNKSRLLAASRGSFKRMIHVKWH